MTNSTEKYNRILKAIQAEDLYLLQELIAGEVDIDRIGEEISDSPLVLSVKQNWCEGIQFLIEAGSDVNFIACLQEPTPLDVAVELDLREIVELLLRAGAYPDGVGLNIPLLTAVSKQNISITERLINAGANVNCSDESRATPLISAIETENLGMTALLLQSGALVNTKIHDSGFEETPLMAAARTGNLRIVKLLIQFGASVNDICYVPPITALYVAAEQGHQEVFDYLLPLTTDSQQHEYARKKLPDGIIRKQRREDKLTSNFISAAAVGDIQGVREAIEAGVDINEVGERGDTALHKASGNGRVEVVRLLLEAGADVEFLSEGNTTPLQEAITSISSETVQILLEAGANPHIKDELGRTLLMLAADRNDLEIIKILFDAGVDINAESNNGYTALEIARRCKYSKIVRFLKESGAVGNSKIDIDPDEIPF